MKNEINWISNLPEVGQPIKDEAREIGYIIENAERELENSKRIFAEAIAGIESRRAMLQRNIEKLWTAEEIAEAKKEAA